MVWVTGASSGIGEALAFALAKAGARLILSARREQELTRVMRATGLSAKDCLLLPFDLSVESAFEPAVNQAIKHFKKIDMLINNGGLSQRSLAKDTALAVDRKLMEVNYFGTIGLTKALLPHFLQNKDGEFVVISSSVGKFGTPWRSGYSASKHALHGFFDSLRAECAADGIRVLMVCPGFIKTDVSINALDHNGQRLNQMDQATQNGMIPDEAARQILNAIRCNKEEVNVGGMKERFGIWMKRHFPGVFSKMVKRMKVR